jgi:lysozyme family protein
MKLSIFECVFSFTLQREGKSSMDPNDPGNWTGGKIGKGELKGTNCGISAKAYPHLDIQNLTLPEIRLLYFRDYWLKCGAERFFNHAPDLAGRVFDLAVNCGVSGACKMLQRAINVVCLGEVAPKRQARWRQQLVKLTGGKPLLVDGKIGPLTCEAILACPYPAALHAALRGEAYLHYKRLDPASVPGWLNRLDADI